MINQRIILAGGGDAPESHLVDLFFSTLLPNKKILFIPQACSPEMWSFQEAYSWIKIPAAFSQVEITMCENINELDSNLLKQFDAIYLMGGNTFKLLKVIRDSKLEEVIIPFLEKGGIVYGLSAGAIVLGAHIETATSGPEKDENSVGIVNFNSLNLLNGYVVATHYVEEMDEDLFIFSKKNKVLAIPEASGVFIHNQICEVLGYDSITIFDLDQKKYFKPGSKFELI